jgi:hypothetical protein
MEAEFEELKKQVAALQRELSRVSGKRLLDCRISGVLTLHADEAEVRKVHHKYGYYIDKSLFDEVSLLPSSHTPIDLLV